MLFNDARSTKALTALLFAYAAASLFHYSHNAEFLAEYPNMPAALSRAKIYAAWLGGTAVGALGYLLLRAGRRLAGLALLAVYAVLGFDGFAHYDLAPASAHTAVMNASIWLEAATATLVLATVASLVTRYWRIRKSSPP
jgi:hypothetical protein